VGKHLDAFVVLLWTAYLNLRVVVVLHFDEEFNWKIVSIR